MARACRDYGRDPRSVAPNVDPDGAENDALRAAVATARDAARARSTRRAAYDAFAPYLYEEAPQLYNASDLTSFYQKYWPSGDASKIGMVGDAPPGLGGVPF